MRVVPDEPTQEMIGAAVRSHGKLLNADLSWSIGLVRDVYKAMLAAHSPAAADGVVEPVAQGNLRKGAERLEATRWNAEYWLSGGRKEPDRDKAVLYVEQSSNAWKNAAYGLAEELAALPSTRAEVLEEAAKICDEIANSADAKDMSDLSNLGLAGRQANQCAAAIRSRGE